MLLLQVLKHHFFHQHSGLWSIPVLQYLQQTYCWISGLHQTHIKITAQELHFPAAIKVLLSVQGWKSIRHAAYPLMVFNLVVEDDPVGFLRGQPRQAESVWGGAHQMDGGHCWRCWGAEKTQFKSHQSWKVTSSASLRIIASNFSLMKSQTITVGQLLFSILQPDSACFTFTSLQPIDLWAMKVTQFSVTVLGP